MFASCSGVCRLLTIPDYVRYVEVTGYNYVRPAFLDLYSFVSDYF